MGDILSVITSSIPLYIVGKIVNGINSLTLKLPILPSNPSNTKNILIITKDVVNLDHAIIPLLAPYITTISSIKIIIRGGVLVK